MTSTYRELDVVVVRTLLVPTRNVTGTHRVVRQPRVGDQGAIVHILSSEHCVVECVDSSGLTSWLADFQFDELAPSLDRWNFDVREVSASVYRAVGIGPRKMHVESTDTDPDKALADCRAFAGRYPV
jgi:hypothetical protein